MTYKYILSILDKKADILKQFIKLYNINKIYSYDKFNYEEHKNKYNNRDTINEYIGLSFDKLVLAKLFDYSTLPHLILTIVYNLTQDEVTLLKKNPKVFYIEDNTAYILHNRVLLVYDIRGWAWHRKANAIQNSLRLYQIDICNRKKAIRLNLNNYNAVHLFGWSFNIKNIERCTTGVSSLVIDFNEPEVQNTLLKYPAISTVSPQIRDYIQQYYKKPIYNCYNGVDLRLFKPIPLPYKKNKYITIGWIGRIIDRIDMHGCDIFYTIVKKFNNNDKVKFNIIDRSNRKTKLYKLGEMPDYYKTIDILLHTGIYTGTPNPLFEAAACGRALISTDVGCSSLLIKHGTNGMLADRCKYIKTVLNKEDVNKIIEQITKYINQFIDNNMLIDKMGTNNKTMIKEWDWKVKAKQWEPLFIHYKF